MKNTIINASLLAVFTLGVSAAEIIKPKIGEPLRDAAVTRGPDNTYYLTGTTAIEGDKGARRFEHNNGVRVWSSKDLKNWQDKGFVWDLRKDANPKGHGVACWQTELYPAPGLTPGERVRGNTAPRIAFVKGVPWISFSMSGYGAGVVVGKSPSVTGKYEDMNQLVEAGGSPTGKSDAQVFVDRDGAVCLVWGGGVIAELKSKEELRKLDHGPIGMSSVGVAGKRIFLPALMEGFGVDDGLPEHGAPYGAFLLHDGKRYVFVFTATTLRDGGIHEDSYVSYSDTMLGDYSKPKPFILDSGRVSLFMDADEKVRVVYSTTDSKSENFERPVVVDYPKSLPEVRKKNTPKPERGKIATKIDRRESLRPPEDIGELLLMIEPAMQYPLRDASICKGPDGTWYMIGTEASWKAEGRGQKAELDWSNNNGIHLWSSPDRQNWKDLGYVWDCDKQGEGWHQQAHLDLTCGATPKIGRAITAPELHYLKDTFWIVYSMNGSGIGMLKSTTGQAEGPYQDLGPIVKQGRDGSLFADGNDMCLVWGQGFYAKLKADMTGLAEKPKAMFTHVAWYPRYMRRPELMGQWGSHLTKAGKWYIWTFTTRTGRGGVNSIDTMASWSTSLDGPWGEPCLMLANGGQSAIAFDESAQQYLATVSGEDEGAELPFMPAITEIKNFGTLVPIKEGRPLNSLRPYGSNNCFSQFFAVKSCDATELNYWRGHPNFIDTPIRDVNMIRDQDGYYYLSGSMMDSEKYGHQVVLFRSKVKLHWEEKPGAVYQMENLKSLDEFDREKFEKLMAEKKDKPKGRRHLPVYETHIYPMNDTYYLTSMFWPMGNYLFKSASGKIEGPYTPIRTVPGVADFLLENDGSVLYVLGGSQYWHFKDASIETCEFTDKRKFPVMEDNLNQTEDCEAGIFKLSGKYVWWSTDWTGNYDMNYFVADTPDGPWRNLRVGIPHGGNGSFFRDPDGRWWYAYFYNTNDWGAMPGNMIRMNMMPVHMDWRGDELIIEPEASRKNRAIIEKHGALWQSPRK